MKDSRLLKRLILEMRRSEMKDTRKTDEKME